jgi:hypothetical protein
VRVKPKDLCHVLTPTESNRMLTATKAHARLVSDVISDTESSAQVGRDRGPYSARNSSKGSLILETHAVFGALANGRSLAEVRAACLAGKLFRQTARETRCRIWKAIYWRFFAWSPPEWVIADLSDSARDSPTSPAFVGRVFGHYARRDRLTFDFVTRKLWPLRSLQKVEVRRLDVLDFLADSQDGQNRWRESTRKKVAGNVLTALRDFGLLTGVQRKFLRRPVVPGDVAFHLCRLLYAEGLRGRSVLEAPDWRLFLWDIDDVARALAQLAQWGKLRFERSGRTVVLEVPDTSGGVP